MCLSKQALVWLIISWLITACTSTVSPGAVTTASVEQKLTVFAAASLTEAFNEIGEQFRQQNPGVTLEFNFAGSQQLRTQLEQGAAADVFASANPKEMLAAIQAGLAVSGTASRVPHRVWYNSKRYRIVYGFIF